MEPMVTEGQLNTGKNHQALKERSGDAPWLIILDALLEDQSLIPRFHIRGLMSTVIPAPGHLTPSFVIRGHPWA